jgi:hypothetical protein
MVRPNAILYTGIDFRDSPVPVIAVFTKFDQFKFDIMIKLEDQDRDPLLLDNEVERVFHEHYLANLHGSPPFVRLESEYFVNRLSCIVLISVLQVCTGPANLNSVLNFLK